MLIWCVSWSFWHIIISRMYSECFWSVYPSLLCGVGYIAPDPYQMNFLLKWKHSRVGLKRLIGYALNILSFLGNNESFYSWFSILPQFCLNNGWDGVLNKSMTSFAETVSSLLCFFVYNLYLFSVWENIRFVWPKRYTCTMNRYIWRNMN